MSEQNKAIVRRLMGEVWSQGNVAVSDELLAASYVHHDPTTIDFGPGIEGEKQRAKLYRTAFPDLQFTIDDMIAEGDTVTARWTSQGTHQAPLLAVAPTGKKATVSGITIGRFANGKLVEGWVNWDALDLLQQLDVVPTLFKAKSHASWI